MQLCVADGTGHIDDQSERAEIGALDSGACFFGVTGPHAGPVVINIEIGKGFLNHRSIFFDSGKIAGCQRGNIENDPNFLSGIVILEKFPASDRKCKENAAPQPTLPFSIILIPE